tara:strand:+ start:183 stop:350 length:168 start_codon:yes stop_codon:yes gene_type:complete
VATPCSKLVVLAVNLAATVALLGYERPTETSTSVSPSKSTLKKAGLVKQTGFLTT